MSAMREGTVSRKGAKSQRRAKMDLAILCVFASWRESFRFVIICGYCTINLPFIMFIPHVNLNSPFLFGVRVMTTG